MKKEIQIVLKFKNKLYLFLYLYFRMIDAMEYIKF
jgi:hypothetical protein